MEVLAELAPEIEAARTQYEDAFPANSQPEYLPLNEVLGNYMPLPREALFLGVANDQLPVLLNLLDPVPGPILVAGDAGAGKTAFLRTIARSVDQIHDPLSVQYGVITAHPEEWDESSGSPNCVEIFPSYTSNAQGFLNSLVSWAHANRGERQSVLLLMDDLSNIANMDFDARQNLRWLLLRGPARRVWPIATINPVKLPELQPWVDFFHTRLMGRVENRSDVSRLIGATHVTFHNLRPRVDFMMREGADWLSFWLPSLE